MKKSNHEPTNEGTVSMKGFQKTYKLPVNIYNILHYVNNTKVENTIL